MASSSSMWLLPTPKIGPHLLRSEDEVIIDEVTHHWICYVRPVLVIAVGVALMLGAMFALAFLVVGISNRADRVAPMFALAYLFGIFYIISEFILPLVA